MDDKRILEITNEEIHNQNIANHPEISTFGEKGQLMMDAFGNKALVYPNGRIEEQ